MREAEDIEGTWCVNLLVSHLAIKKLCFSGDSLIPKTEITDDFRAHEFIRYECHPCGNQLIHSITVWVFWLRTFLISVAWIWTFSSSSLKLSPPSLCYLEPHKERSEKIQCQNVPLTLLLLLLLLLPPWDSAGWRPVCSWKLLALPFTSSWMDLHGLDC